MTWRPCQTAAGSRWHLWRGLCLLLLLAASAVQAAEVEFNITGVGRDLERNVERHLEQLGLASRQEAQQQRSLVLRSARKALQALGYYDADIRFSLSPPERSDIEITLDITPGEPVRWQDTRVTFTGPGMDDPLFQQVVQQQGPRAGDILNHQVYEDLKRELRQQALSHGYFDVAFRRQKLLIDRAERTAVIDLELATGQRFRFGPVAFSDSRLSDRALQRLIPFAPGEFYDESLMTRFNRNLLDTGYFRSVALVPTYPRGASADTAVVRLEVDLDDNEYNRVSVGAGYGTDTGPRVRLNWLLPMVNRHGHSLQFATSVSEPRREFTTEYKIPDGKPGTDFWSLQGGYLEEIFEDNQYRQNTAGLSRQELVQWDWTRTWFTRFKREQGSIEGVPDESRPSDAFFITPGISFSRLVTDGGIRPTSGHKLVVDLEFSDPAMGSDTEYVRLTGLAKWLLPMTERQQLLLRLQLGMIWSQDFNQVPVSTRFFAGGDQSIRGYGYNTLGPRDDSDALVGGSRLMVSSAEYLYRFLPNWQAALFVDHGGAMDETTESTDTGAGIGLRWLSPLGVIGFDLANAVSDDNSYRVHITMGAVL